MEQWVLEHTPAPSPAIQELPRWYKEIKPFHGNSKFVIENRTTNATVKKCVPFLDYISAGYILKTWCDIYVTDKTVLHEKFVSTSGIQPIMDHPREQIDGLPIDDSYESRVYKWMGAWTITTPEGYSVLVLPIQPSDNPFMCLPAVVDTDAFLTPLNYPFVLKKDFRGLIPKGTPYAQVIPFRREEWESRHSVSNTVQERFSVLGTKLIHGYRQMFHKKKVYY